MEAALNTSTRSCQTAMYVYPLQRSVSMNLHSLPSHWTMIWCHSYGLGFIRNHFEPAVSQNIFPIWYDCVREKSAVLQKFRLRMQFACLSGLPQGIAGPALQGVQHMPIIHVETPPQNPVPDFIQCFDRNLTNFSFAFNLFWDILRKLSLNQAKVSCNRLLLNAFDLFDILVFVLHVLKFPIRFSPPFAWPEFRCCALEEFPELSGLGRCGFHTWPWNASWEDLCTILRLHSKKLHIVVQYCSRAQYVTLSPHLWAISTSLWGVSNAMQCMAMATGSPLGARSFLRTFQGRVPSTLRYPESEGKDLKRPRLFS